MKFMAGFFAKAARKLSTRGIISVIDSIGQPPSRGMPIDLGPYTSDQSYWSGKKLFSQSLGLGRISTPLRYLRSVSYSKSGSLVRWNNKNQTRNKAMRFSQM